MIGKTISHYKILEELGRGGMGVVYRARDKKLDREVAIKFLPSHMSADSEAKKRFVQEAKSASALDHPNICTIHEIDETEDNATFIVMACYQGLTLRDMIDERPLEIDKAVDIASQISSGLAKAHENGIVHRDIKPANIILTTDGHVKILDFGIAKLAGKTKLTKEGSTLGTAAYMSPEQARGEEVDHRSDIFSLGSILYEMLAGEPPFKGEHEAALLYCIVHEDHKPLSEYKVDIPEPLHAVVDMALEKEQDQRYQNVSELRDDLDFMKESSGSITRPVRAKPKSSHGRRWIMAATGIVIIAAVTALVLKGKLGLGTARADELALAVIGFRDLTDSEESKLAAGLTSLLNTGLIDKCPIRVVSDELIQYNRRKVFGESTDLVEVHQTIEIARKSKATYFISGEVNEMEGKRFAVWRLVEASTGDNLTGGMAGGDDIFSIADEIIEGAIDQLAERTGLPKKSEAKSVTEVTTEIPEAYEKYIAGMTARDRYAHREAIEHLEMAVGLDSTFALAYLALSKVYFDIGTRGGPVIDYWDKAWTYRNRVGLKDRERLRVWGDYINWAYGGIDDIATAYEDMLDRWPDEISVYREISGFLFYEWYWSRMVPFVERGLEYYPDDVILRHYLAFGLAWTGETERALKEQKLTSSLHPDNKNQWDNLGLMYIVEAFPDSAEWAFGKALDIDGSFWPSKLGLGHSAYCMGNIDRAIENHKRILVDTELMPGERRTVLSDMRSSPGLAALYAEAGRYEDASDAFEEAREYASSLNESVRLERERSFFLLRANRADEVLEVSRQLLDSSERNSGDLYAYENGLQLRMMALVALDSLDAARETIGQLREIVERAGGYTVALIDLHESQIDIKIGKADAAIARLEERRRRGMNVGGMLYIYFSEICSRAHEAAGDFEAAAEVHRALLRIYGGHALSHYELGKLYEELGQSDEAILHYEKFLEMWRNADEGLPQPEYARARLEVLMEQT